MGWEMKRKGERLEAIIESLAEHVPALVEKVINSFYSPEAADKISKGVAQFYRNLKDGGIPEEEALNMTKDYLSNLTFRGMGHMCRPMWMRPWMMHRRWPPQRYEEREEEEEEEKES